MRSFRFVSFLLRRSREESGVSLVEVLVSAVLLVVAGGGLLSAIDAAGNQSNEQRHQAIAADLAQAEVERLTGLRFSDVQGLTQSQPKSVGGTTYTVSSTASWALKTPTGPATCSASGRSPAALKLLVTVTWPNMARKPVTLTGMRAAPTSASTGQGNFVVQITNRNGLGVSGIGVAMTGPTPMSGTTDADGCIRFNEMTAGNYTVGFNGGGKITPAGLASVSEAQDVVAGQTRSAIYELDTPGTLTISSFRYWSTVTGSYQTAGRPSHVSIAHAALASPITNPAVTAASYTKSGLYPFSSAYGVYADNCTAAAPPGTDQLSASITPSTTTSTPLTLPALSIQPDDAAAGDQVYVKTVCGNILGPRTLVDTGSSNTPRYRLRDGYPYASGADANNMLQVCVIKAGSSPKRWIKKSTGNNNAPTGGFTTLADSSNTFDMDNYSTSTPTCGWAGFVAP